MYGSRPLIVTRQHGHLLNVKCCDMWRLKNIVVWDMVISLNRRGTSAFLSDRDMQSLHFFNL